MNITYFEIYKFGKKLLEFAEMLLIFEKAFHISRKELFFCKDKNVSIHKANIFFNLIFERKNGRPLAYVLGETQFMDIHIKVREGVLIPRDDTEVLVREGLYYLNRLENGNLKILDLCSGTGIIALAIERHFVNNKIKNFPKISAIEISKTAIEILNENIKLNNSKINVLCGDIFEIHRKFKKNSINAIFANPPYIESEIIKILSKDVQKEPLIALDGGITGLDFYEVLSREWFYKLKKGGFIAMEVGYNQSEKVFELFFDKSENIIIKQDINGINRVVIAFN